MNATEPVSQEEANATSTADQYDDMAEMNSERPHERPQRVVAERGMRQRRMNNMV